MGLQQAAILYPVNSTTVDSAAGIDIRLLDSAEAGANDDTQDVDATHTQDNVERTFDPATAGVTAVANATSFQGEGWALRLVDDMTPADDTNCNAYLPAGNATVSVTVAVNQAGGIYTGGSYGPTWRAALFRYDPATDTGTLLYSGSNSATTWNYTPVTGDLGIFKTVAISVNVTSAVEFAQGEILLLQLGLNTGIIPNPTLGTATWTYTLRVDHTNTKITWAGSQAISALCPMQGSASGVATVTGAGAPVLPTQGSSSGAATVLGSLEADAEMTGSASGVATVNGVLEADAEMTGSASGSATVAGSGGIVIPTVGTVDIGAGGGRCGNTDFCGT